MNIKAIKSHVESLPESAIGDIASGSWDEVMTDALYAACGAETISEMGEAKRIAESLVSAKRA